VNPREARLLCATSEPGRVAGLCAGRSWDGPRLRRLLAQDHDTPAFTPGDSVVELAHGGRSTTMTVHLPPGLGPRPGVIIALHGAGGSGEALLPYFAGLGDRLGMAVLAPNAQLLDDVAGRLDVAGMFAKRFRHPRWAFTADDFPIAALRWALEHLDADSDRCVLVGVSMGGLACWNLAMRLWSRFAAAVPINGALSVWEAFGSDRRTRYLLANTLALPLFVIHGAQDRRILPRFDRASVAQLREANHANLTYVEVPDGDHPLSTLHFEDDGLLVAQLEAWLTGRRRMSDPGFVRHRALDDQHARAHWIALSGVEPSGAAVTAERVRDDVYRIDVTGAQAVRLYLTSDHLEAGQGVAVVLNGQARTVRFEPAPATVAATYREHLDPAHTAEAVVTLPVDSPGPRPSGRVEQISHHAYTS